MSHKFTKEQSTSILKLQEKLFSFGESNIFHDLESRRSDVVEAYKRTMAEFPKIADMSTKYYYSDDELDEHLNLIGYEAALFYIFGGIEAFRNTEKFDSVAYSYESVRDNFNSFMLELIQSEKLDPVE